MSDPVDDLDVAALKEQVVAEDAPKQWRFATFADTTAAADFIALPPAQNGDEVSSTVRGNGTVGLFYYL